MKTILVERKTYKIVGDFVFLKKIYYDCKNERLFYELSVCDFNKSHSERTLLDYMDSNRFNETVDKTINDYLDTKH